jgi:hypothetical protein
MSEESKPSVLIVDFTLTNQAGKVADAIAEALEARGCDVISRRYFSINLREQRKLAEENGGHFTDTAHSVADGGQVKSMLSWLGYMKHGEAQERVMGLKMPAPNLQPDFEAQAKTFAASLADSVQ